MRSASAIVTFLFCLLTINGAFAASEIEENEKVTAAVQDAFLKDRFAELNEVSRSYRVKKSSLRIPLSGFEVYVQPWFPLIPVPIYVAKRSEEEQVLLAAVETWSHQLADPTAEAQSLAQVARVLRSRKD